MVSFLRNDGGHGFLLVTFCGDGNVVVVSFEDGARLARESDLLDERRFTTMRHFTKIDGRSPRGS